MAIFVSFVKMKKSFPNRKQSEKILINYYCQQKTERFTPPREGPPLNNFYPYEKSFNLGVAIKLSFLKGLEELKIVGK